MKVKFLSVATVVALFVASCGGVDKKVVDDINKFEGDWTTMVKNVSTMSETMTKTSADAIKECDEICSKECKDKKMQAAMDSMKMGCTMSKEGMTSTMGNVTSFKADLDKTTTEFTAWKDKVMKGEINAEQANKDLAVYQAKLTDSKDQMTAMNTNFETSQKMCKESCKGMESCCEKK
jgi:hypothetical protein